MITSTTMRFAALRLQDEALSFSNPRKSSGLAPPEIRELAFHILAHGVLTPLLVTKYGLIIAGQRRYRALEFLQHLVVALETDTPEQDAKIAEILAAIPVRIIDGDIDGISLADNLLRTDLSSYEIAARLVVISDRGVTGREIARLIGKDPGYVSKKLSTYRKACPELRVAWEGDTMTEDVIMRIADLDHDKQRGALAGTVKLRGPNARPKIEAVKDALLIAEVKSRGGPAVRDPGLDAYRLGVLDALRWVTGQRASPDLTKLVDEDHSQET